MNAGRVFRPKIAFLRGSRIEAALFIECLLQAALSQATKSPISRDAIDPSPERLRVRQPRQRTENVQPNVLQGVFRGVCRTQQLPQKIPQAWRIPLDQLRKRRLVAGLTA